MTCRQASFYDESVNQPARFDRRRAEDFRALRDAPEALATRRYAMQEFLLVGLGGWLGAISRYYLGNFVSSRVETSFPLGTFVINLTGCFILGLLGTLALNRADLVPREVRLMFSIGFVGAYTTFSTYSFETIRLVQQGSWQLALANVLASTIGGLIAVVLGVIVANAVA